MDKKDFKVGQQCRDGGETTIIKITDHDTFPVQSSHESHTVYGTVWSQGEDDLDLIELVQDVTDPSEHPCAMAEAGACLPGHCTNGGSCNAPSFPVWAQPTPQPLGGIVPPPPPDPMPNTLVTTQASEPAIPDTEIARTIAQFISSKELALNAATDQRERLERQLADAVARESDLRNEIGQAKTALAVLK